MAGLVGCSADGEDVLAGTHELDDGESEIGIVDRVGCALGLEEGVEGGGVGCDGEGSGLGGGEGDDTGPAFGGADDAAEGGAAGLAEIEGHGLVGGDHEVGDEVGGAVVPDGLEGLDLAVDDDGIGFDAVEVEGAEGDAMAVEALGRGILQAELGGEEGIGVEEGLVAAVLAGGVFEEGASGGVGELGLIADEGGVDGGACENAFGGDGELDDDCGAGLAFVEAGEIGGELEGEHGEVLGGGVDGLGLGGGGAVEGRILGDGGGYVGDGDEDAGADCFRAGGWGEFGVFDLVEVSGGVVVDGGPEEVGEVLEGEGGVGSELIPDLGELGLGSGIVGVREVEAIADHFGAGGGGEVEGRGVGRGIHAD